jgi:cell division protein FtsL
MAFFNKTKTFLALTTLFFLVGCYSELQNRQLQNEIEELKEDIATQEEIEEVAEQAKDDMEKAERIWERDQAKK